MYMYSVRDKAAEQFGPIFEAINDAVAVRQFKILLAKVDVRFKEEYMLYKIGSFDKETGNIENELTFIDTFIKSISENDSQIKSEVAK